MQTSSVHQFIHPSTSWTIRLSAGPGSRIPSPRRRKRTARVRRFAIRQDRSDGSCWIRPRVRTRSHLGNAFADPPYGSCRCGSRHAGNHATVPFRCRLGARTASPAPRIAAPREARTDRRLHAGTSASAPPEGSAERAVISAAPEAAGGRSPPCTGHVARQLGDQPGDDDRDRGHGTPGRGEGRARSRACSIRAARSAPPEDALAGLATIRPMIDPSLAAAPTRGRARRSGNDQTPNDRSEPRRTALGGALNARSERS
jgi:hypothetical protein